MTKFKPKISYDEVLFYLERRSLESIKIRNDYVYELVKKLTSMAYHEKLYGDLIWEEFYLPIKLYGKLRLAPFTIRKYKQTFFVFFFRLGILEIKKGKTKVENFYKEMFKEVLKYVPILKKHPQITEKLVPYYFRKGKIKAKWVMESTMPKKEAEKILKEYEDLIKRNKKVDRISLNDYLKVAGICYKAAFKEKAKDMNNFEMYKKWADGRDCGMLEIRDKYSKKEFMEWLNNKAHCGGHPFEIVFSWTKHGVLLYPPYLEKPYFTICFSNYAYAETYAKMISALIKNRICFRAPDLKDALEFLTGEKYLSVNEYGEDFVTTVFYSHCPSERKLFKHIEWEKMKVVKLQKCS